MGKDSSTPPPDPRLVEAQIRSLGVQDAAIQKIMANADRLQPLQEEQMRFTLDSQRLAQSQAGEDRDWAIGRRGLLAGMQNRLVSDAAAFNTGDRADQLAGQALGDVNQAFSNTRDQGNRGLARMGVNPSSGRYAAFNAQTNAQQGLAMATAASKVREAARQEGYALTDRATNALAGYPSLGMQATNAMAGYGVAGLNAVNAGVAGMNSGYGQAVQGAGQMGSNASSMWGAQANSYNAGAASEGQGTGAAVGAIGTAATIAIAI